jgi:type II secretory pathway component PulJ
MFSFLLPYIISAIIGVISGSFITSAIKDSEISELRLQFEEANRKAEQTILTEFRKAALQKEKALNLSNELELSHEQSLNTINTLDSKLKSIRLREGRISKSCSSTEREGSNTEKPSEEASTNEFAGRLHEFLIPRAYNSGINDEYAASCYKFVVENNCGISKEEE